MGETIVVKPLSGYQSKSVLVWFFLVANILDISRWLYIPDSRKTLKNLTTLEPWSE